MALLYPVSFPFAPLAAALSAELAAQMMASPAMEATSDGWLVKMSVPGLSAKDVSLEVVTSPAGASHLKIAARDASFRHSLRVPADAAGVAASVQHGLLRVRVPKLVPKTHDIRVAAAAPQPAAEKTAEEEGGAKAEAEPEVVSVQMAVPGLSSDEVSASVCGGVLTLKGASAHGYGQYMEQYRLTGREAVERAEAFCQHGVLCVRLPLAPEEHVPLAVSADEALLGEGAGEGAERAAIVLEEAALPGFSAADVAAEVRGRVLHLRASQKQEAEAARKRPCRRVARSVLLPAGADASRVQVVCANGVLRATLPRDALGAPAARQVPISEDSAATAPKQIADKAAERPGTPGAEAPAPSTVEA